MAAPKGNRFWEIRAKHGRDRLLTDPEALRDDCIGYFEWVENNPLEEEKIFSFQGVCNTGSVRKPRAMTVEGLCLHLGIGYSTWRDYANRDDCKDISEVMSWAESVMRDQKFTGAAVDIFNQNIIARDLGLRDTSAIDHTSSDGTMTPTTITRTIVHADGKTEEL